MCDSKKEKQYTPHASFDEDYDRAMKRISDSIPEDDLLERYLPKEKDDV